MATDPGHLALVRRNHHPIADERIDPTPVTATIIGGIVPVSRTVLTLTSESNRW
jgi:hypothetical protein